jgi:thiol-disulfide isomerase/thioredoxin
MSPSFQIGPLAFPSTFLVLLAGIGLGAGAAKLLGRNSGLLLRPLLWQLLIVGIVVARLAYIWPYRAAYLSNPLDIINLRDGGWDVQTGIIAAWLVGIVKTRPQVALRKPVIAALATTSVVWAAGAFALAMGNHAVLLPSASVSDFEGGNATLAAFKGKPIVVNLWATWCPPCRREMPVLQKAQAAHPDVHFVFLNQGESNAQVQQFLSAQGIELRNVLLDQKGQVGSELGNGALPTTLFFDAEGRKVATHLGELSTASLAGQLAKLGSPGRAAGASGPP